MIVARGNESTRQIICQIKVCVGAKQYDSDNDVMAFYGSYKYKRANQRKYV